MLTRYAFGMALLSSLHIVASPLAAQTTDPLGLAPVTLPGPLDRVLRDYEAAWKGSDGARLAALFTDDGMSLSDGGMPVRGRAAIAKEHTQSGGDLMLRAFAYATSDSVGYIIGAYRYPGSTGPGGKFLLALRKGRDGRWLIAADMDNSARARR
jgi:ketosteroid isomerase-like protein